MATRFELVLHGESAPSLRAAGEEVLEEIERLENRLSLYRAGTEIARVNEHAAREPVPVTPGVFALLAHARQLWQECGGGFDITVAPLVRCWGFMGGSGEVPDATALAAARSCVGMGLVSLDAKDRTVSFAREGVMLDLGAIGKGYAIERGVEILREAGITSALFHGGTSTVYALGSPPEADAWNIALEIPPQDPDLPYARRSWENEGDSRQLPSLPSGSRQPVQVVIPLRDEALSVSAVWGKFFHAQGRKLGHVLDPRTGEPSARAALAAVVLPSATETDALSTALLVEGAEGLDRITRLRAGMKSLVAVEVEKGYQLAGRGLQLSSADARTVTCARIPPRS